jgi:hypothetical protein
MGFFLGVAFGLFCLLYVVGLFLKMNNPVAFAFKGIAVAVAIIFVLFVGAIVLESL